MHSQHFGVRNLSNFWSAVSLKALLIIFLIFSVVVSPGVALAGPLVSRDQKIGDKEIAKESELPKTYELLETLFEPMVKSQKALALKYASKKDKHWLRRARNTKYSIAIIKDDEPNAFVLDSHRFAYYQKGSVNVTVGITAGLLAALMSDAKTNEEVVTRIIGVLAHELAHPLQEYEEDHQGERGLDRWIRNLGQQKAEAYADARSFDVAGDAGFPRDAIYAGLARINWTENEPTLNQAIVASHPIRALRLSLISSKAAHEQVEGKLTKVAIPDRILRRFERTKKAVVDEISPSARTEIQLPTTFSGISESVDDLKKNRGYFKLLKQNLLFRQVQKLVFELESKNAFSASEKEQVVKILFQLAREEFRPESLSSLKTKYGRGLEVWRNPELVELFAEGWSEKTKFFRDVDQLVEITKKSDPLGQGFYGIYPFFPRSTLIEGYNRNWRFFWDGSFRGERLVDLFPDIETNLSLRRQLADIDFERLTRQRVETNGVKYLGPLQWEAGARSDRFFPFVSVFPFVNTRTTQSQLRNDWAASVNDPLMRASLLKRARYTWEHRQDFASLESYVRDVRVDWEWVWSVLGIEAKSGRKAVVDSVRDVDPAKLEFYRENPSDNEPDRPPQDRPAVNPMSYYHALDSVKSPSTGLFSQDLQTFYINNPLALRELTKSELKATFSESDLRRVSESAPETAAKIVHDHFDSWVKIRFPAHQIRDQWRRGLFWNGFASTLEGFAAWLSSLQIPKDQKVKIFSAVFLDKDQTWWFVDTKSDSAVVFVINTMKALGISRPGLIYLENAKADRRVRFGPIEVLNTVSNEDLEADLKAAHDPRERLIALAGILFNPARGGQFGWDLRNYRPVLQDVLSPVASRLRAWVLERSQTLALSPDQRLRLTDTVLKMGASSPEADRFLELAVKGLNLATPGTGDALKVWKQWKHLFINERFHTTDMREKIQRLVFQSVQSEDVDASLEILKELLPKASPFRDSLLDEYAWKFLVTGTALKSQVLPLRTNNISQVSTFMVNKGSAITTFFEQLTRPEKLEALRYLTTRDPQPVPPSLQTAIARFVRKDTIGNFVNLEAQAAKELDYRNQFEDMQANSDLKEKAVLCNIIIIASGRKALENADGFPFDLIHDVAGVTPGSRDETAIIGFMNVMPANRKTIALSYFLANRKKDEGGSANIAELLEIFKIVGKKFGQDAAIYNVFGKEQSENLGHLKDNAPPLTKTEIEAILDRDLSRSERAQIKLIRVIGSASIKTVVEVELADGRRAVLFVQPDNAKDQVHSSLELALDYLNELKAIGMDLPMGMFQYLVEDTEAQIEDELDFLKEAKSFRKLKKSLESTNSPESEYQIYVPKVLNDIKPRKNLLLIEMASGAPWKELAESERPAAGDRIVRSCLQAFWRLGVADGDRHVGNFWVDPVKKVVTFLDLGQAARGLRRWMFLPDVVYNFAQFIRAISTEDSQAIVRAGKRMAVGRVGSADDELVNAVREALVKPRTSSLGLWVGVINAMAEKGLRMDPRYTVVALKLHSRLEKEGYVPEDTFKKLVAAEVEGVLRGSKLPLTAWHELTARKGSAPQCSALADGKNE